MRSCRRAPARGLRSLDPLCPPSLAWGLPAFWAPLVAGLLMWRFVPSFEFVGGHPHSPLPGGRSPHGPPRFCPPPWAEGLPAFWVPLVAGLPMWATRPPCFILGAHPPCPLGGGAAPSTPNFAHPRGLRVCQRFGSYSWAGLPMWRFVPSFEFVGGHPPQPPAMGAPPPPGPPIAHPRGLKVCQGLGSHSWAGLLRWATRPLFLFLGAHPPNPCQGAKPPGPPLPTPVGLGFASVLGPTRGRVC